MYYRVGYVITQRFGDNAPGGRYAEGYHGAIDTVGNLENGRTSPKIYPILSGTTLVVSNSDPARGKGIRVRTHLDAPLIDYLKSKGVVPQNYNSNVILEHFYWHLHEVTDLDGKVGQDTPIGIEGNTGFVVSNGIPVPDSQKGQPPYPGRHTHHEHVLKGDYLTFNTDKDPKGRINPEIILNYEGESPEETDMLVAIKRKTNPTIYAASGNTLFPFSSGDAFIHAGGDWNKVKELDDAEFYKFDVRDESPIGKK